MGNGSGEEEYCDDSDEESSETVRMKLIVRIEGVPRMKCSRLTD